MLDLGGSNAPWYNKNKNNQFIAIDNSAEMVKKCQANLFNKIDNSQKLTNKKR